MLGRSSKLVNPDAARPRPLRRRTALVAVLALFTIGLAGCGDPDDDDDDGGGGGYVAAHLTVQSPASGAR